MPSGSARRRYAGAVGWGLSLPNLVQIVAELERSRIGFENLTEKIETNSAVGKLVFHVFAALAEFEGSLIRERTHAGLAAVCARGRSGGRKPKLGEKQVREINVLLRDPKIQIADVARRYRVSRTTLYTHVGVVVPRSLRIVEKDVDLSCLRRGY